MEFDSIIYIVIAIILAIINAVAQKKKKAAGAQPAAEPFTEDEITEHETEPQTGTGFFNDNFFSKSNPLEVLFSESENMNKQFFDIEDEEEHTEIAGEIEVLKPENQYQDKLLAKAIEILDTAPGSEPIFSYDDDSIASTAIGNVLSEEDQEIENYSQLSDLQREFDIKKAIIYSEIINPKYFTIGPNI